MTQHNLFINIENPKVQFKNHLNDIDNPYILFSGRYGTGKSTFLEKFFSEYDDEYFCIILKPINYAVSQNEDIFEIIKVDILTSLFTKSKISIEEELRVNKFEAMLKFAHQKPLTIASSILKGINISASIGGVLSASVDFSELINKFSEFEEEYNKKLKSDSIEGQNFLIGQMTKVGSIFEFNIISQIINNVMSSINSNEKKTKTVLVIDDLDRIDPDHIFRILNVFSAHNDFRLNHEERFSHKFGFSKVILVADKTNLHNIFKHRYGSETDFDGYLAKFYSKKIFDFSNEAAILNYLECHMPDGFTKVQQELIKIMLMIFVKEGSLRVRNIVKPNNNQYENFTLTQFINENFFNADPYSESQIFKIDLHDFIFTKPLQYISTCFGDTIEFCNTIDKLSKCKNEINSHFTKTLVESFALLFHFQSHQQYPPRLFYPLTDDTTDLYKHKIEGTGRLHLQSFSIPCTISTVWSIRSKYKGNTGFFNNHRVASDTFNSSDQRFMPLKYNEVFAPIKYFIEYLKKIDKLNGAFI